MKQWFDNFAWRIVLPTFCLILTGCQTHKSFTPLSNGYEEVKHPTHAFLSESAFPRVSFEHRESDNQTTLIWPSLYGVREVVKNDLAIFVGDTAYLDTDSTKGMRPRIFAVKSPELPLDITDEVLWRWSKANGKNFAKTLNRFSLITPEEKGGYLELHLEFWQGDYLSDDQDWPDKSDLQLDWQQVATIMNSVKNKGVLKKDLRWHTPYIGEQF